MNVDFVHIDDWPWGRSWFYVIDCGICVGRACRLNDKPDEIYIDLLSVEYLHRRQGYGSYFLQKVECLAASTLGVSRLRLWVDTCKPENVLFYEANGFRKSGFVDEDCDLWEMIKDLEK